MKVLLNVAILLCLFFISCQSEKTSDLKESNPAAQGFDVTGSDSEAIALADEVMNALGGRKAWDNTNYIKWNFFNARRHIWNKKDNEVVIEGIRDTFRIQMNINDMTGTVDYNGRNLTKADSLDRYLEKGKSWWINDSYWLVMPYKLKDSGVTLSYLGQDTTQAGIMSEKVELTFKEVGDTPQNKYHVYIDQKSKLVNQWDYFPNYQDTVPRFSTSWDDYQTFGSIKLSGDRGNNRRITEIETGSELAKYFK
jgi:hypothetical protein